MAIEAPYSKYRRQNCVIIALILVILSGWCAYDGYMNDKWIEEHTNEDGGPQPYLTFNRQCPFYAIPAAVLVMGFWFVVRNKKIIGDENELIISENEKIPYDSIEKIDKTHFDSKGYFTITYKDSQGTEVDKTISYKAYDGLKGLLEHIVEKIS